MDEALRRGALRGPRKRGIVVHARHLGTLDTTVLYVADQTRMSGSDL